jgi:hypothetical protein
MSALLQAMVMRLRSSISKAQREFRINSKFSNFMKGLRVEQYKLIYFAPMAMGGTHPKRAFWDSILSQLKLPQSFIKQGMLRVDHR